MIWDGVKFVLVVSFWGGRLTAGGSINQVTKNYSTFESNIIDEAH